MNDDVESSLQLLMAMSGRDQDICWEMLEMANFQVDVAASLLLGEDERGTGLEAIQREGGREREIERERERIELVRELRQETTLAEEKLRQIPLPPAVLAVPVAEKKREDTLKQELSELLPAPDISNKRFGCKLLIPQYRLEEALRTIEMPILVDINQINILDSIHIPGGITVCDIYSDSYDSLEYYLLLLSENFTKYSMSVCFTIETITKKENREQFISKMESLYYDLLGIDLHSTHLQFHEQAIYRCSVLRGDEADPDMDVVDARLHVGARTNQIAHILTITMAGLPELLLVLQEACRTLASSFSMSKVNGSGSFSCIPDEWSLLCHTVPFALVLLEPNGKEWRAVLENGKWSVPNLVKCIHRIENIELWRAYCTKRDLIERLRGGDPNEQWLWHGTRNLSPEIIACEGFDFRVANSGLYGRGAYFAYSINYSLNGYQHTISQTANQVPHQPQRGGFIPHQVSPSSSMLRSLPNRPNSSEPRISIIKYPPGVGVGDNQVILARVCVGHTAKIDRNNSLTRPPDGYDSVTGDDVMSIVYDLSMAYPAYIVTYR